MKVKPLAGMWEVQWWHLHPIYIKMLLLLGLFCCILWPAFGCWALQRLVKICVFNFFLLKSWKNAKKRKICRKKIVKNCFFEVCTKTLVKCFIHRKKNRFFPLLTRILIFKHKIFWKCIFWPVFAVRFFGRFLCD